MGGNGRSRRVSRRRARKRCIRTRKSAARHFPEKTVTLTRDHNSVMALMLRPQSDPSRRAEKKSVSL